MVYAFEHPAVQRQGMIENEAGQRRLDMLRESITPDVVERLVSLHQSWPDIPPGVLIPMAMSGIDPNSDIAQGLERRAVETQQHLGFDSPGQVVEAQQLEREQQARQDSNLLGRGLRTGVRTAFAGMESAYEEVSRRATSALVAMQDPNRTYAQAMELSTPSMWQIARDDPNLSWSENLGEGLIPAGEIRQRQESLKHNLTLDGEWMSPGRAVTINVFEPDSAAFNFTSGLIDAAFRIFGDPATYATAGAAKLRMSSRLFATDSAIIRGVRGATDEQFARQWWLNSAPAQRLRQHLVDETDPYQVWRQLGGPQGRVQRDTARRIAEARTLRDLDDVVMPRLGPHDIAEKPIGTLTGRTIGRLTDPMFADNLGSVHGVGYRLRRSQVGNSRLMQWMPDRTIDTSDPERAMVTLHRFLQGIRASEDDASRLMGRAFRIGTDTGELDHWLDIGIEATRLAARRATQDSVGARQVGTGTRAARTKQKIEEDIGRVFERQADEVVNYFQTEAYSPNYHVVTWMDGTDVDLSKIPHLTTEYLARNIPLPDMQLIRRHIGPYAKAMRTLDDIPRGFIEGSVDLLAGTMSGIWKPLVLLRGAYIARVVGEEQARMAASGLDSTFRHPLSYLAYLNGRKGGVGLASDMVDDMRQFQKIAQRKGEGHLGRQAGDIGLRDWVRVRRYRTDGTSIDDPKFVRAWADDLSLLVNDEPSRLVAARGVADAQRHLTSTAEGRLIRRQIAESSNWREVADSPEALRRYLETVQLRIEEKTRGNTDLIAAIATGRLDGKVVTWTGPNGPGPSELRKGLQARLDEVDISEVWGRRYVDVGDRGSSLRQLTERFDSAVDVAADFVMSKPTNFMSRFPTWRQAYVRNVEAQLGFMDAPTQRQVIRWAQDHANLSRSEVARMQRTARAGQGTAVTDVEAADMIARANATRDTRKLLYELTELGQFSDASRAAIPFAEAWKEIFTTWARIVRDRPQTLRRGQMAVEGARGSGFFHTDPSTGEEMFTYPGGRFVSRALLSGAADSRLVQAGLSVPGLGALTTAGLGVAGAFMDEQPAEFDLQGRVTGLNLFAGSFMPGLGPTVTLPASRLLPDRPNLRWIRDNLIFPFGAPDIRQGLLETTMPAWLDKLHTGWLKDPDTDRVYANSVFDVARALMSSGEYSTDTPEEVDRLLTTAKQRAKGLWLVRGASQFVLPTGPQPAFRVQDLEGDWWPYQVLASEFHRINQEHGEQQAVDEFLATFGSDLLSMVQSKSREIVHRPVSEVGDDWIQANAELARDYQTTIGLVAPDDPLGHFSYEAYRRQFDDGTREQLTPEQMVWLSNNLMGRFAYSHAVDRIDASPATNVEKAQARAHIRGTLTERFPGFNSHIGVRRRPDVDTQIREVEQMVEDPRLADNRAVHGAAEYLEARRAAQTLVELMDGRSRTFTTSEETAPIRTWLRQRAREIATNFPEFLTLWERVFERELADEHVVEPGQLGGPGGLTADVAQEVGGA